MLDATYSPNNKNKEAITIVSEIYQDAIPTLTSSICAAEPQHQNAKTNQVNR